MGKLQKIHPNFCLLGKPVCSQLILPVLLELGSWSGIPGDFGGREGGYSRTSYSQGLSHGENTASFLLKAEINISRAQKAEFAG